MIIINLIGIPTTPGPEVGTTCSFTISAVTVALGSPLFINTDLAYYEVEVITDGSVKHTMTVAASNHYNKNSTKSTTINNFDTTQVTSVQARVTAIDKCGQRSVIPLVINCIG